MLNLLSTFKIFSTPKFSNLKEALYEYKNKNLFIYVDISCPGLTFGRSTQDFKYRILPEFIEVAAGLRENQCHSTSKININA